jgi:hypothetical protein
MGDNREESSFSKSFGKTLGEGCAGCLIVFGVLAVIAAIIAAVLIFLAPR